ncbi:hypothetical protein OPV22_011746 [Ensete ventricosum]|uniref:Uncharacterized protein n=1 Tax=Ensete ventricosum TaxID=4639 RepID=A0AAV8RM54_ENSVE|nr:hypothetical protein OPV22_011746 [Ensete ventricosum]
MVRFSRDTQRLLSFPTTPSASLLSVSSNPSSLLLSLAFSLLRADWSFEQIPPVVSTSHIKYFRWRAASDLDRTNSGGSRTGR